MGNTDLLPERLLHLMAAFTFPCTTSIASEQAAWARDQLREAMEGNKTRYKELTANAEAVADAEAAVLLIASRKKGAYERARQGINDGAFGWVQSDPDLAAATSVLNRLHVQSNDIDTMPDEIAKIVPQEDAQAALF